MSGEGTWTEVPGAEGDATTVEEGRVRAVSVDGVGVVVARCEGRLLAAEDRCTHDDGPLGEGRLEGCEVVCPRHGARFDLRDGRVTRMPAVVPLRTVPVREEGGRILLDLGDL